MKKKLGTAVALLAIPAAAVAGKVLLDKMAGQPAIEGDHAASPTGAEAPLGGPVSRDLLDILVCPEDKGPLELVEEGKYLLNPRTGYRYPIRDGIPIMLIDEGKANRVPV